MNPEQTERITRNIRESARAQATNEHRENYLRSCEAHGPELAAIVQVVRSEFNLTTLGETDTFSI